MLGCAKVNGATFKATKRRILRQMWNSKPSEKQVLLWLRRVTFLDNMLILQYSQSALCNILRVLRPKAVGCLAVLVRAAFFIA